VCGALVLAMLPNPWLAGLGITFLSLKPQIGILPILFILLNRRDWKLLIVPAAVYFASFIHWGWWIPDWLSALNKVGKVGPALASNIGIYPYGFIFLLLLWRYRSSLKIWMFVQSLIMPYSPIYSLAPVFTLAPPPIWVNILIWAFYLFIEKYLAFAFLGFIFPLAFLFVEIWWIEKQRVQKLSHEESALNADAAVHDHQ
jgi:hypothetical protein